MKPADFLDLIRVPNLATAVSDIVAAAAIGAAVTDATPWADLILVGAASACLYSGGMALNDVADAAADARLRPARPIPSGRVARGTATGVTVVLLGLGLGLAAGAGRAALGVGLALTGAILLYDLALAGRPLWGPLGMALCRGLNLSLGLVAAGAVGATGMAAVGILMLYVFGLTHLSLGETGGSARSAVGVAALTTVAAALGVVILGRRAGVADTATSVVPFLLVLGVFLARGLRPLTGAFQEPIPGRVGPAVGMLVTCILWLDASLAAALGGPTWLLPFLPLVLAQETLRRTFRVT